MNSSVRAKKPQTKDFFDKYLIYDERSSSFLRNKLTRGIARAGEETKASVATCGYRIIGINYNIYLVHRVIYTMHHGTIPEGMIIDHIDGDKSNNIISNLRCASKSQNQFNRQVDKRNKGILPKGICMRKSGPYKGFYLAAVKCMGKRYFKQSKNLDMLTEWLEEKRNDLHGDFANNGIHIKDIE